MEKHTGRFHKIVSALSSSPLATSVRTLFLGENSEDTESPSIQGNSEGLVNVQEVVSEAAVEAGPEDGAVVGAALRDGFGTYGIGPMVTEATTDVEAELAAVQT